MSSCLLLGLAAEYRSRRWVWSTTIRSLWHYFLLFVIYLVRYISYYFIAGWHFIFSSKTCGSLHAFFEKHLSTWQLFTSSSLPARPSRDIPSQEAYCISKTTSPKKKILLSSILRTFKFPITMAGLYYCIYCHFHYVCSILKFVVT